MGFAKKINAAAVIHCGDWNTADSVRVVLEYGTPVFGILGNADIKSEVEDALVLGAEGFEQKFLSFKLDNKKIGVIHDIREPILAINTLDVVFYGHTHKQKESEKNGARIVNPGALENEINFAVYDTTSGKIDFVTE